jgi:hypothetical protein
MKIYLAHALTNAPEEFRQRMFRLRDTLASIPNIEILRFAWIDGVGPKPGVNVYEYDMNCVSEADLVVAILDHFSFGVGMEIQKRSQIKRPMLIFAPTGMKVPKIITDCLVYHNAEGPRMLLDPVTYSSEKDIIDFIKGMSTIK